MVNKLDGNGYIMVNDHDYLGNLSMLGQQWLITLGYSYTMISLTARTGGCSFLQLTPGRRAQTSLLKESVGDLCHSWQLSLAVI